MDNAHKVDRDVSSGRSSEPPSGKTTLTDIEVASRLGVSRFTVRSWRLKGIGPRFLKMGRAALTEADRTKFYALAQQRVTQEHLWMPVMNIAMYTTSVKKLKGVRLHMLYQNTFYKGLDYAF